MQNDSGDRAENTGAPRDALFTPSLAQHTPRAANAPKPWRVNSQVWIAFFGGVLPLTLIAYLNSKRLGVSRQIGQRILLVGFVGFAAAVAINYLFATQIDVPITRSGTYIRLASRIAAFVCYLVVGAWQRPADRAYNLGQHAEYSSLWGPGIAASLGLGVVQNALIFGIARLLQG